MYYVLYNKDWAAGDMFIQCLSVIHKKSDLTVHANHQYSIDGLIFLCVDLLIDRSHIYLHNRVKNI